MQVTSRSLADQIIDTWAKAAGIPIPIGVARQPLLPPASVLARGIKEGQWTLADIAEWTTEKVADEFNKRNPGICKLYAAVDELFAWKHSRGQQRKRIPPPPGWKAGTDHLGRRHVWDWLKGEEIVYTPVEVSVIKSTKHSPAYVPMSPNERLVKCPNREGYMRDLFLSADDSDLSPDEVHALMSLAGDGYLDDSPF
jgi:hypothetical protein